MQLLREARAQERREPTIKEVDYEYMACIYMARKKNESITVVFTVVLFAIMDALFFHDYLYMRSCFIFIVNASEVERKPTPALNDSYD